MPDDDYWEDFRQNNQALYAFMFHQWQKDTEDQYELAKNTSYLIGMFINPEMAQKLQNSNENTYSMTDEEFDKLSDEILEESRNSFKYKKKRKRKKLMK